MKKNIFLSVLLTGYLLQAQAQTYKVKIETNYGPIVMELYDATPKHRDNMVKLVKEHFYDSTLFHRCIPNFVIQGGDPTSKHATAEMQLGNGENGYRVDAEFNDSLIHKYGALGMARDNNPAKASSGCQFYIVTGKKLSDAELDNLDKRRTSPYTAAQRELYKTKGGTAFLDGGYTVFGEVLEGMDIVEKISNEPRNAMDRPLSDVRMLKVTLLEAPKAKKKKKFLGIF